MSGTHTSEPTPSSALAIGRAEARIGRDAAREQRAALGDARAADLFDHAQHAARAVATEPVLRHDVEPPAAVGEGDEAAIAARVLDRELHRLAEQPVHVGGLAEQAVGLLERAELVAGRERDRDVLALELAAQRFGAILGLGVARLAQPLLRLLEQRERLIVVLALGFEPREREQRTRRRAASTPSCRNSAAARFARVGHRLERDAQARR